MVKTNATTAALATVAFTILVGAQAFWSSGRFGTPTLILRDGKTAIARRTDTFRRLEPGHQRQVAFDIRNGGDAIASLRLTSAATPPDTVTLRLDACSSRWLFDDGRYRCPGRERVILPNGSPDARLVPLDGLLAATRRGRDHLRVTVIRPDQAPSAAVRVTLSLAFTGWRAP